METLPSVAISNDLRVPFPALPIVSAVLPSLRSSRLPFVYGPVAEPPSTGGAPPSCSIGCLLLDAASFEESLTVKGLRVGWALRLVWRERGMTGTMGTTARGLVVVVL